MAIQQQHQELAKVIEEYQAQDLHGLFPWMLEQVCGSLDGSTVGWDLLRCHKGDAMRKLLQPSGPLMRLTLGLQDYSYEVPLVSLPSPVRESLSQADLALSPMFQDKLQTQNQALSLNSFEIHMLYLASTLVAQKLSPGKQLNVAKSVYFLLMEDYLTHFLPLWGSMPIYPNEDATVGDLTLGRSWLNNQSTGMFSLRTRNLIRSQASKKAEQACQDNWASWTMLQIFVEIWMADFNTQGERPGDVTKQQVLLPSEAHMLALRQLLKHLHAFSGRSMQNPDMGEVGLISGQVLHLIQSKVFSLLQHCFTHWPLDPSFRVALETWLSYIQPWRYAEHKKQVCREPTGGADEHWSHFVQENLQVYSAIFRMFLRRASCADLTESSHALMLFRVTKVFAQPWLPRLIHTGEQQQMNQHLLSPAVQNPKNFQTSVRTNMRRHGELQGSHCVSMFDSETHSQVLQLLQKILQARCSVNQASLATQPRIWPFCPAWFSFPSQGTPVSRNEGDEVHTSILNTTELLDRAKLLLCQIFKLSAEMMVSFGAVEEEEELPDCVEGENGLVLTDLGRMQIINEVRRVRVQYGGDPDLQPVRSYESTLLVKLMAWITSHINKQFGSQMVVLCSRQDLVGSICRHLLLCPLDESERIQKSLVAVRPRQVQRQHQQVPRVSLRVLASYRTLLSLLLVYVLGCALCSNPLLLCGLVVMLLTVLDPLSPRLSRWSRKYKHVLQVVPRLTTGLILYVYSRELLLSFRHNGAMAPNHLPEEVRRKMGADRQQAKKRQTRVS
ncbi:hypothetical protein AALO_G00069720 [Alosa alosa]|uniref:Sphingomyelin phosphodiesterase 4 n=1 Tax=Alosa alosa TaxID=278164 RepID=A0AAV6H7E5_9TELE|nr:hypothetical protein AALO_G00069720 [Alosa alosa]